MNLSVVLRKWRLSLELDQKAAAGVIGIETKSLRKIEQRNSIDPGDVGKVIGWLFSGGPAPVADHADKKDCDQKLLGAGSEELDA